MADNQTTAAEPTNGRVTRVQGSVIDVEFPVGHLPDIYNALKVTIVNTSAKEEGEAKETEITLEVEQHLGDSTVRCVALKPTDGGSWCLRLRHRRPDLRAGRRRDQGPRLRRVR